MSSWEQLDSFLGGLTEKLNGTAYIFSDAGKLQLSPADPQPDALMMLFERAWQTLLAVFGATNLRRGRWKRHLHHESSNWFVAEPLLSAYHVVVVFESDHVDEDRIATVLDQARPILTEIISGLPPLDGGHRANEAKGTP